LFVKKYLYHEVGCFQNHYHKNTAAPDLNVSADMIFTALLPFLFLPIIFRATIDLMYTNEQHQLLFH